MKSEFISLIGKNDDSLEMDEFLEKFKPVLISENHPPSRHFLFKESGLEIASENGCINAIFIYVEPQDGFSHFKGDLPGGIKEQMTQEQVESLLGVPNQKYSDSSNYVFEGGIHLIVSFNPELNDAMTRIFIGTY